MAVAGIDSGAITIAIAPKISGFQMHARTSRAVARGILSAMWRSPWRKAALFSSEDAGCRLDPAVFLPRVPDQRGDLKRGVC
ncbi:MAG: hypothetical protein AAGG02_17140 [Cyanobacteria bacterium P01_H01_bin.15]